ncbi:hypothetical protein BJX76DRAFT_259077 [Aspergillus varians]
MIRQAMATSQPSDGLNKEELKWRKNIEKQYDGNKHRDWSRRVQYTRPNPLSPSELEARIAELRQPNQERPYRQRRYLNFWGENKHVKFSDLENYYSSTRGYPRRLAVQATDEAWNDPRPRNWNLNNVKGHVPFVIRLAELCLNPLRIGQDYERRVDEDEDEHAPVRRSWYRVAMSGGEKLLNWIASTVLTLLLSWIIQLFLSIEIVSSPWTDDTTVEPYKDYENFFWHWPKHAINVLDQSPLNPDQQTMITELRVRRLVVWNPEIGDWETREISELVDKRTGMLPRYIFLSFSRANYPHKKDEELTAFFHSIARDILDHENKNHGPDDRIDAFWVDTDCVSQGPEKTEDINTICDAVRFAARVYILLPSHDPKEKENWGKRIWTLPEALLAADRIQYYITGPISGEIDKDAIQNESQRMSLREMYTSFWPELRPDHQASAGKRAGKKHEPAIGHLVNHYTNATRLSELQIFTCAIQALAQLTTGNDDVEGYTSASVAYAAMGLLSYRLNPNATDSAFQAIARLSLVNDTNSLLERLLCMWPYPAKETESRGEQTFANGIELLHNIADPDQYESHLWDIKPLCDVVGIGDDDDTPTVILDRCRGIPIRWKDFPRFRYGKAMHGFRATISQSIVSMNTWFIAMGINVFTVVATLGLASTVPRQTNSDGQEIPKSGISAENAKQGLLAVAVYVGLAWIVSWFSPRAVHELCNGDMPALTCCLVGFEGTLTLEEIERTIYGTYQERLVYGASTTLFAKNLRHKKFRYGEEKGKGYWERTAKELGIPSTHRLFTIVDTGSLTVSVIAAERPPVVALICGREGGMLRTLLCSWQFESNTLFRESVMRMPSSTERMSTTNDWLKLSLASQGDVGRMRLAKAKAKAPPTPQQQETLSTAPSSLTC